MSDKSIPADKIQELIEWYEEMNQNLGSSTGEQTRKKINESFINDLQSILPTKTMKDVKWDGRKHHLAEAMMEWSDQEPHEVVMIDRGIAQEKIKVWNPSANEYRNLNPAALTPTGRMYKFALDAAEETPESFSKELESLLSSRGGLELLIRMTTLPQEFFEEKGEK